MSADDHEYEDDSFDRPELAPPDPDAHDPRSERVRRRRAKAEQASAVEPVAKKKASAQDWGFDDEPETKLADWRLGLMLVLVLAGGFGFVAWRKYDAISALAAGSPAATEESAENANEPDEEANDGLVLARLELDAPAEPRKDGITPADSSLEPAQFGGAQNASSASKFGGLPLQNNIADASPNSAVPAPQDIPEWGEPKGAPVAQREIGFDFTPAGGAGTQEPVSVATSADKSPPNPFAMATPGTTSTDNKLPDQDDSAFALNLDPIETLSPTGGDRSSTDEATVQTVELPTFDRNVDALPAQPTTREPAPANPFATVELEPVARLDTLPDLATDPGSPASSLAANPFAGPGSSGSSSTSNGSRDLEPFDLEPLPDFDLPSQPGGTELSTTPPLNTRPDTRALGSTNRLTADLPRQPAATNGFDVPAVNSGRETTGQAQVAGDPFSPAIPTRTQLQVEVDTRATRNPTRPQTTGRASGPLAPLESLPSLDLETSPLADPLPTTPKPRGNIQQTPQPSPRNMASRDPFGSPIATQPAARSASSSANPFVPPTSLAPSGALPPASNATTQFPTTLPSIEEPSRTALVPRSDTPTRVDTAIATRSYRVGDGESYWTISKSHYGTVRYFNALAAWNQKVVADPRRLRPGMTIELPPADMLEPLVSRAASQVPTAPTVDPLTTLRPEAHARRSHQVRSGENYWSISKSEYGTSRYFAALAKWNKKSVPDPRTLRPGNMIELPPAADLEKLVATASPDAQPAQRSSDTGADGFFRTAAGEPRYRVGRNETLSDIAQRTLGRGSRWPQIFHLNRNVLPSADRVPVGAVLALPRDALQTAARL